MDVDEDIIFMDKSMNPFIHKSYVLINQYGMRLAPDEATLSLLRPA